MCSVLFHQLLLFDRSGFELVEKKERRQFRYKGCLLSLSGSWWWLFLRVCSERIIICHSRTVLVAVPILRPFNWVGQWAELRSIPLWKQQLAESLLMLRPAAWLGFVPISSLHVQEEAVVSSSRYLVETSISEGDLLLLLQMYTIVVVVDEEGEECDWLRGRTCMLAVPNSDDDIWNQQLFSTSDVTRNSRLDKPNVYYSVAYCITAFVRVHGY